MQAITIEKITKKYENTTIFENLNFTVNKGEVITILGKSGGGKSTLLRCVSGLEKINNGTIKIFDRTLVENGKYQPNANETLRKVGMVFQDYNLFENMTVKENILAAPKNQKLYTPEKLKEKYENLVKELGIEGTENKYPTQISGGQSQRVAIARSLMLNPEIILFDEPTSALDIENSMVFVEIVNKLSKQGYTVIIVTHDTKLVENLNSKTYTMIEGILEEKQN